MEAHNNLFEAYKEYIQLLGEELSDLMGLAFSHGWESSRIEAGATAREKIKNLEEKVDEEDDNLYEAIVGNWQNISNKRTILKMLFDAKDFELISFYYYPSAVRVRLLEQTHNGKTVEHDLLEEFGEKLIQKFEEETGHRRDNKIVIEFRPISKIEKDNNSTLFLGWHDGKYCIGLEAFNYDGAVPIDLKKKKKSEKK